MLGPLTWWPAFKAHYSGGGVIFNGFIGGTGTRQNQTDVFKATTWHSSAAPPDKIPQTVWKAITTAPGMIPEERWKQEFNLTPHCLHGTTTDVCYFLGEPCGLDPATEADMHGNWTLQARTGQASNLSKAPVHGTRKRMRHVYSTGANRRGSREHQLYARWKLWRVIQVGAQKFGPANITLEGRWAEVRSAFFDVPVAERAPDPRGPPSP